MRAFLAMFVLAGVAASAQTLLAPLETASPVPYFIGVGELGSQYRPGDRQLAEWALQAWQRTIGGALRFEPASEGSALVRVYWVAAEGGEYGEMRPLFVGQRRGAAVYIRPDTDGFAPAIARQSRTDALLRDSIVYLTCVHEIGHALGLSHTSDFRDVMYFFGYGGDIPEFFARYRRQLRTRDDIGRVSGVSDADAARVRALYR